MGNINNKSLNQDDDNVSPSIDTPFKFPSPLPTWPSGQGFASGVIDLGGLEVSQISSFTKVWASHEGGPDDLGATFFEPSNLPNGFFMLGSYSQRNNLPLFGFLLVGKDLSGDALKVPIDYTLVWTSENLNIKQDGVGYIWLPIPPEGYKSVGHVVTTSPQKPSLDKIRCVRADLTDVSESDDWIWRHDEFSVYSTRPKDRGIKNFGVFTGAFVALNNGAAANSLACLKNVKENSSAMPNLSQVQALFQAYSPLFYFHPNEEYYPSSVNWYFQNGVLLYTKGQESAPVAVQPDGANLPQGGSNDGAYWLDLPTDNSAKDRVKNGDIQSATSYLHIKPVFGATHTDIALWLFYPFNGPARAKIEFINIKLGKIGQHVGDWEHVTLRISNFNGELQGVYFSQHSGGDWMSAPQLEFENGNKPVAYSSYHGHASYAKSGQNLQGSGNIGIRNDTAKGQVMDTGANYAVVAGDYLKIVEPAWLNYAREWGPKISYDIANELNKIERLLPGKLKRAIEKLVKSLPSEVLGEEGPTGPKFKDMWNGDERG
ncbi:putative non-specific lipid-transfer protein 8-like [Capsicum annuum]|uniref:Vacuolar protein sorting-associated protein 62 n=1 Tax=Capsicum annuum TaxID=4072 RepID=A0A1U8E7L8_CAPAN|nr:uncharacterized protein LOC107843423 [Capsicum annuum]KAF3628003.1 putative non-specific lipid-transfer protein 8-like [Capsicum annuum]KAF3630105.1 putative non-specific lipid-transfer protein 8-like [Capsicum annuum]PHT95157.1 hypothetical protein T459_03039 [Capsicum annuum]